MIKKILLGALLFLGVQSFSSAIATEVVGITQNKDIKDCVTMIDGQMYVIKDGKQTEMNKAVTMSNGTKVLATGVVYLKDGEKLNLANGDRVYMNGDIERKGTS